MLKDKILQRVGSALDEWLLGFNKGTDFNVSMFSTEKVNVRNAIINSARVNEELRLMDSPMILKAGMIGRISVKVSAHSSATATLPFFNFCRSLSISKYFCY